MNNVFDLTEALEAKKRINTKSIAEKILDEWAADNGLIPTAFCKTCDGSGRVLVNNTSRLCPECDAMD